MAKSKVISVSNQRPESPPQGYHSLIPNTAKAWGLNVEGCTAPEPQRIVDAFSEGKLVVAIMLKGAFYHRRTFYRAPGCAGQENPGGRPGQLQPQ